MTPAEVKSRRLELQLTVGELAYALRISTEELERVESGESNACHGQAFEDAFAELDGRLRDMFVGV
ncbi:MAG TPA: hypothetical protein VFT12_08105 [Thermoanaerobaculia bacterium]|nr:hypothetical protein [Thermoanaerobaculia bacterium]